MMSVVLGAGLAVSSAARAEVDPNCSSTFPSEYVEQVQVDWLLNYIALSSTLSPVHAPVPHEGGHGAIGVDLGFLPPVSCNRRYALGGLKTEDTNKTPVLPRLRASFAFEVPGDDVVLVPYAGLAYAPPVPVAGTRNVLLSGEAGLGLRFGEHFEVGGRGHATLQKTVADAATSFEAGGASIADLYLASTFGLEAMAGWRFGTAITPYVALGFTDVSTFFWIGDDGVVSNNLHPYLGPTFSVGADGLVKDRLRWGAELYGAPGGHGNVDESYPTQPGFARYGSLYTVRIRLALEL